MSAMRTQGRETSDPRAADEPNLQQAIGWWPDLNSIWTPVGWKNHLFRFNVMWDGAQCASTVNLRNSGDGSK